MTVLSNHILFLQKRLRLALWAVVSVGLCFIGHDFLNLSYEHISFIFLQLIAFRYLDEWGCFEYDLAHKNRRFFNKNFKPQLLLSSLALFVLSLCFGYENSKRMIVPLTTVFVGVSLLLYRVLNKSKFIFVVSLVKYPFLIFLITQEFEGHQLIVCSALFIIYFLYEYKTEMGHRLSRGELK